MRIIEWNINQATNVFNKNNIPSFVINEIINKKPDVFILTEFAKTQNCRDIYEQIGKEGFEFAVTDNKDCKQNDVLIAWKSNVFNIEDTSAVEKPKAEDKMPEVLVVPLTLKSNNEKFIIVGLRIKLFNSNYEKRKEQLETVIALIKKKFSDCKYCIIGGDFNNLRSDYEKFDKWKDKWSLGVINKIAEENHYVRKTPKSEEGSSIYKKNNKPLFQEDHYLVSEGINMKNENVHYCRHFTENNPTIYLHGEDFQVYDPQLKTVTWTIPFGSGIPDHAMLIADFELSGLLGYKEKYLEPDEYPLNKEMHPYAYECPMCNRIIANDENFSIPPVCDECSKNE